MKEEKNKVKSGKDRQPKGFGGLRKLDNGNYEGTLDVKKKNGDGIFKSFTRKTEKEINHIKYQLKALEPLDNDIINIKINKITNEITLIGINEPGTSKSNIDPEITVIDYVDYWLWNHRRKGVKRNKIVGSTFEDYVQKCEHIKKRLGVINKAGKEYKVKVKDLTFNFIEEQLLELYEEVSEYTVTQVKNHVYNMLKFAKKDGIIRDNPLQDEVIRFPKCKQKKKRKHIDPKEEDRVVKCCLDKWFIDVLTQFYTGSRVSEIRGLRWDDLLEKECAIRFDENFLSVKEFEFENGKIKNLGRKRKYTDLKTEASYAPVPIPEEFLKILLLHKQVQMQLAERLGIEFKETDPMFTTSTYKQLGRNDTNDRLKQVTKELQIDNWEEITSHCLRHGFCYMGLLNDVPLEYMSILLRHEDIKVTRDWYAEFSKDQIRKFGNKVNENRTKELQKYKVFPMAVNI